MDIGLDDVGSGAADGAQVSDGIAPTSTVVVVHLPCRWVAAALSGQNPLPANKSSSVDESSLWKQKWSGMRLVDTVVLDGSGNVDSWIFTTKSGCVTSRKKVHDRVKIAERFERFALANPSNKEAYVALASNYHGQEPGERVALDKAAFQEAMLGSKVPQELLGSTLQCYLRPQKGSNSFLRACYRGPDQPSSVVRISPLYRLPKKAATVAPEGITPTTEAPILDDSPEAAKLQNNLERVVASLVEFLELRLPEGKKGQTIRTCQADLIIDDNGDFWLVSIPSVAVTAPGEAGNDPHVASITKSPPKELQDNTIGEDTDEASARMPLIATNSQVAPVNGGGSPLGSARQSRAAGSASQPNGLSVNSRPVHQSREDGVLPAEVLPSISTMLGARSSPGDHSSRAGGKQVQPEPIFDRKGGVYVANVHASALRGLCSWREVRQKVFCCWALSSDGAALCAHASSTYRL